MLNSFYYILTFVNIRFLCSLLISLCGKTVELILSFILLKTE